MQVNQLFGCVNNKEVQRDALRRAQVHPPPASAFRGFEQYVDDLNVLANMGGGSQAAPEAAGAQACGPELRYAALRDSGMRRMLTCSCDSSDASSVTQCADHHGPHRRFVKDRCSCKPWIALNALR